MSLFFSRETTAFRATQKGKKKMSLLFTYCPNRRKTSQAFQLDTMYNI